MRYFSFNPFSLLLPVALMLPVGLVRAQSAPTTDNQKFDEMLSGLLSHPEMAVSVEQCPNPEQAVFLDARAKTEYEVSHIPTSRWVGFSAFSKKDVRDLDPSKPVVVYCSVGYRSEKITRRLKKMGFSNVRNLYGGIFAWKNQGRQVVNTQGQPTDRVHTYNKKWGQWLFKGTKVH